MKKLLIGILLLSFSSFAYGARLDEVEVLDVAQGKDNVELKLQVKGSPKDSYFVVDIVKNDPEAFDKLGMIIEKIVHKSKYKLSMQIPSFSANPPGSYYKSDSVTFKGMSLVP